MYFPTSEDIVMLNQSSKPPLVWVELLNLDFQRVDEIKGSLIEDNFSIDATSDTRRLFNLTFLVINKNIAVGLDKKIWADKYVKIDIGTTNIRTGQVHRYPMGIYVIDNIDTEYSGDSSTISLSCSDLSSTLNGTVNGTLISDSVFIEGADIRNAMIETITKLGGIKKYRIGDINKKIPYKLEFSNETTIWQVITQLRDLYDGWETFFDIDGTFVFQPIPTCEHDVVILSSEQISPLVVRENCNSNIKDIRNVTKVRGSNKNSQIIGIAKEVLKQPTQAEMEADYKKYNTRNIKYIVNPDSPYAVERIGERLNLCSGGNFEQIYSEPLALQRAEYENWLKTRMIDIITLEMILIPWLNMNEKIEYTKKQTGETYQFITKKMSGSISKWNCNLEISRFFPEYPFIVEQ